MAVTDLRALVTRGMTQYEREEKTLDILLFAEIFDHIVRIDRVLSVEGGALLLVGRSGAWPHIKPVSASFFRATFPLLPHPCPPRCVD